MDVQPLIVGMLLPALLTVAILVGLGVLVRPERRAYTVPLALGAAVSGTSAALFGLPGLLPADSIGRLFYIVLLATALGLLEAFWRPASWRRWIGRLAVSLVAVWWLLGPIREHEWEGTQRWYWPPVLVGLTLAAWASLERARRRLTAEGFWPAPVAMTLATATVALCSGSLKYAQLSAAAACAMTTCWLLALCSRLSPAPAGSETVPAVTLCLLWMCGYFFAEMPATAAAMMPVAAAGLWIAASPGLATTKPWKAALLCAAAAAAPLIAACAIAWRAYVADEGY